MQFPIFPSITTDCETDPPLYNNKVYMNLKNGILLDEL